MRLGRSAAVSVLPATTGVPSAFWICPIVGTWPTVTVAPADAPVGWARPRLTDGPSSVALIEEPVALMPGVGLSFSGAVIWLFALKFVGGASVPVLEKPPPVVTDSVMRPTRSPGPRSDAPSPPSTAAVAAVASSALMPAMTRSMSSATGAFAVIVSSGVS